MGNLFRSGCNKPIKRISRSTEGALFLLAASFVLLLYGYVNERLFHLGGATFPAVALLVLLIFSALEAISKTKVQGNERQEKFLSIPKIAFCIAGCCLYLGGVIYVGYIVTTALALIIAIRCLSRRISFYSILVAMIVPVVIWFLFTKLGGSYFPPSWLF